MHSLFDPIAYEPGVGPKRAELLAKLPVRTPGEMLFFFPRDYEDFSNFTVIRHLKEDELQTICARILNVRTRPTFRGSITSMEIEDGTYGLAEILFFNQPFRANGVEEGQIYLVSGKPKYSKRKWQFSHPVMRLLTEEEIGQINANTTPGNRMGTRGPTADSWEDPAVGVPPTVGTAGPETLPTASAFLGFQPVYRLTDGLHQWDLRRVARTVVPKYAPLLDEAFPEAFREKHALLPISEAVQRMHFPKTQDGVNQARRRFVFQEFFLLQLALEVRRRQQVTDFRAPILEATPEVDRRIRQLFPYDLTQGQLKAISDITRDTTSGRPMNRLLQGDVGCGKTTVAVYAILLAVAHGFQAAIMAPTEVLARQHVRTMRKILSHSPLEIVELVGGLRPAERQAALEKIASGAGKIVIGTHALLQKDVNFANLAMVVIDEQHKFGVNQRAALRKSGQSPHYLVMTATPIPRSVTMTLFGDLDLTTIRELPPGRQQTKTYLALKENRAGWWTFFAEKLRAGAQGYVVVPRIGEAESLGELKKINETQTEIAFMGGGNGARSAELRSEMGGGNGGRRPELRTEMGGGNGARSAELRVETESRAENPFEDPSEDEKESDVANLQKLYRELSTGPLAEFPIGILHGRMTQEEKEAVMFRFRTGELKVLISTQVIEVGVDIPNATLMTIDSAEFFGLAQLHQLRGRITRGPRPGYCCVFPSKETEETLERLRLFTSTNDGFELSETDFKLRGPGNLFGTQQHGLPPFKVANLLRDQEILEEARQAARETLDQDPGLSASDLRLVRQQMLKRYGAALELGDVG
ncbi:MAG: ATP-dependent DNA helicase RecG [Thermoguttaceae bacterium]|nr:ATP-dependent DNA helicase RecG [Thermoguttaceae bacterium]